jgi:MFS family permease
MTAFASLLFASRGWTVWPAFTSFAIAFMLARLLLGALPDKLGGAKVALIFVLIESFGLAMLWAASWRIVGVIGALITGVGYSLLFPGFGVEAIRRAPARGQGLALGAYTAFLDLTLALASPVLGLIGGVMGMGSIFLTSAVVVLASAVIAMQLLPKSRTRLRQPCTQAGNV